ncbi:flagellar export chaperone FliS [Paenibacillus sp. F411]|uniref:flagellar export chaperone FliS n=1 Tax=Paenibacillus sp. F411 TaxID=2820239 RepID=UPI001AAED84D|nr:flagellar export chaperone FliS [Paenibacillus sp. F411]MBO2944840.1 flagellar export chaperone FliS [Paenibacillus sp. F411]
MNQALNTYFNTQVTTATPGELTLMLYNGCVKFLKLALKNMEAGDYEQKNNYLIKATNIIDELLITLDMKYEISQSLSSLYVYIKELIIKANVKSNHEPLLESIQLVTELRDTWNEALKVVKA